MKFQITMAGNTIVTSLTQAKRLIKSAKDNAKRINGSIEKSDLGFYMLNSSKSVVLSVGFKLVA